MSLTLTFGMRFSSRAAPSGRGSSRGGAWLDQQTRREEGRASVKRRQTIIEAPKSEADPASDRDFTGAAGWPTFAPAENRRVDTSEERDGSSGGALSDPEGPGGLRQVLFQDACPDSQKDPWL